MPGEEERVEGQDQVVEEGVGENQAVENEDHVTISKDLYESLLAQISEGTAASKKVLSKVEQ